MYYVPRHIFAELLKETKNLYLSRKLRDNEILDLHLLSSDQSSLIII